MKEPWFTIEKIDEQTFAISEYGHWEKVRSFLILGQDQGMLIDTGLGIGQIHEVVKSLTSLPYSVYLTHVHWDHTNGLTVNQEVYLHESEGDWLANGIPSQTNQHVRGELTRDISQELPADFQVATFEMFKGSATDFLSDGQVIELGGRAIQVLHTPGHSPGHLVYYDLTSGYLFTGDLLYSDETPIYAFYPSTNPLDLVNSWEKIARLEGVRRVFPSHNQLELGPEILPELLKAKAELLHLDLVHFGTGIHQFPGFKVQF